METYLIHPQHGTHIAYTADEVHRLTTLYGWSVKLPDPTPKAPEGRKILHLPKRRDEKAMK